MAVTIHDTPQIYTPSDNPVNWTFSSDKTAEPNFVYLVEVYIGGVLTANELVFPDNGIYGRFDASSYASNATQPMNTTQLIATNANNYADVRITVIERYGEPVVDGASAVGTAVTVWKARMSDDDFIDWVATDYIYGSSSKWLTNFPTGENPKVRANDEQIRIAGINDNVLIADFRVRLYDVDDVLIVSDQMNIATAPYQILTFNISPVVIVASSLGITQANFDAASYYVIDALAGVGYEEYRIDIDTNCFFSHYKRIHFLTEWGSIEALSFDLISKEKASIKSFGYRNQFGEWNGSAFGYTKEQGRDIDFAKVSNRQMEVESDWLTEDVQHWLIRNLYESPVVFIEEDGTGINLIRRKITNTAWMDMYHENDMLFKEKITLKLPTKTSMIV